jgi:hypothetical protein
MNVQIIVEELWKTGKVHSPNVTTVPNMILACFTKPSRRYMPFYLPFQKQGKNRSLTSHL